MKIRISSEEWYPVHSSEGDEGDTECEVPEEIVNRWRHIEEQFSKIQKEMSEAIDKTVAERNL